jgi:uracil-DNA glycosylase
MKLSQQVEELPKLLIILDMMDYREQLERKPLVHDGGRLLRNTLQRISVPRNRWVHGYFFNGQKSQLPTKQAERHEFMLDHVEETREFIASHQPCVIVGMGKLTCECFLRTSTMKWVAGRPWKPRLSFRRDGIKKVWISHSPNAALFDPNLIVDISRVLGLAAREAGIDVKINFDVKMFEWDDYK